MRRAGPPGCISRLSRWTAAALQSRRSAVTTASSPTICEPRSSAASSRRSSSSCCGPPCSSPCAPRSATRCSSATTRRELLEQLERQNLFVVALDHQRRWFRYHHLFREMLQAELERREPELSSALNRRAAAWCNANGQPEVAIEYSVAAGDTDEVATARRRARGNVLPQGRVTTVERWLAHFDDSDLLERYPAIAVLGAWVHALRGRPEAAERWALAVETARSEGPMPDGSPLEAWAATVRALLCRKGVEQMQIDAELALSRLPATSQWYPVSVLMRGMGVLFSGEIGRAEVILGQAAEAAVAGGATWAGVVARSERALLALERGDLAAAESELALAGAFVDDAPSTDYVVTAILLAVTARLADRQGARRASPNGARGCAADTPDDDARPVLVRGAYAARARESASGPVGRTAARRRSPARQTTSFADARRSARSRPKPKDVRAKLSTVADAVIGLGVDADRGRASPAAAADDPSLVPGRSPSGCSSPATPSRPRRSRSTASSMRPVGARRSNGRSSSGWSTHRLPRSGDQFTRSG